MLVEKLVLVNSQEEAKVLAVVNSREEAKVLAVANFRAPGAGRFPTGCRGASWVRLLGEQLREACFRAVSGTTVVAI